MGCISCRYISVAKCRCFQNLDHRCTQAKHKEKMKTVVLPGLCFCSSARKTTIHASNWECTAYGKMMQFHTNYSHCSITLGKIQRVEISCVVLMDNSLQTVQGWFSDVRKHLDNTQRWFIKCFFEFTGFVKKKKAICLKVSEFQQWCSQETKMSAEIVSSWNICICMN